MKTINHSKSILFTLLILSLIVSLGWTSPVNAQENTVLRFDPNNSNVYECDELEVWVDDVTNLYGYDIQIKFDQTSIEVLDVENGGFLGTGSVVTKQINNTAGTIRLLFTQTAQTPKTGSGVLIRISFNILKPGVSSVITILPSTVLSISDGVSIPEPTSYTAIPGTIIPTEGCPYVPHISFVPEKTIVCAPPKSFDIAVRIDHAQDLYSYALNITYPPAVAPIVVDVKNGDFLDSTNALYPPTNWPNASTNPPGTIRFEMAQGTTSPKSGSGNLILIKMYALTTGLHGDIVINLTSKLVNSSVVSVNYTVSPGQIFTDSCIPNAVDLKSFDVLRKSKKAILTWETASELNNVGFNIYRSGKKDGTLKKMNTELIPAEAVGSSSGAQYEFINYSLKPWKTYFYWLEWVDMDSNPTLYGPIKAKPPK